MIVVDVNVLLAAHLARHPHHAAASGYLTRALHDDAVVVPGTVWTGFLRIATNPRVFEVPSSLDEAIAFVRAVRASPGYREIEASGDRMEVFLDLCVSAEATANLVPDAYIAAVALMYGCGVATFDRDFRRFDGLTLVAPA